MRKRVHTHITSWIQNINLELVKSHILSYFSFHKISHHITRAHQHIKKHHKKYLLGSLGGFAIIKMMVIFVGSVSVLLYSRSFATFDATKVCADVTAVSIRECEALLNLYNNTDGDKWGDSSNWGDIANICKNRQGVTCTDGKVTKIDLSSNLLSGKADFSGLPRLTEINVDDNLLTSINVSKLTNLGSLIVSNNTLTSINVSDLINLNALNIENNKITTIDIGGLHKLDGFYASNNLLSKLPESTLEDENLGKGKIITLNNNCRDAGSMSSYLLTFLDEITDGEREISISNSCPATTLCQSITDVPKSECEVLANLYKSTNGDEWKSTEARFKNTTVGKRYGITVDGKEEQHVTAIDLHGNGLVGTASFVGLPNVISLLLGKNQITSIDVSDLTNLETLSIGGNLLSTIDVSTLTNLTTLEAGSNNLSTVDVSKNTSLVNLDLRDNKISSFDSKHLDNLSTLYLNSNQFSTIDINPYTNLTELDISDNQITSLSNNDFSSLTSLSSLNISPSCNTNGTEYITYQGGTASTDSDNCVAPSSTDVADFTGELETKGYTRDGTYNAYVGGRPISFNNPSASNEILAPLLMTSSDDIPAAILYQDGTTITQNGDDFTDTLYNPTLYHTGNVPGIDNATTLMKFGNLTKRIDFSQDVTIIMPAPGKAIDEEVNIYSSDAENIFTTQDPEWHFEATIKVKDINGEPYVQFTTNHASRWTIGDPTFCNSVTDVPWDECNALISLYNTAGGTEWFDTGYRGTTTVGNRYGITVDGGHVTEVNLSSNNLSGVIPKEINGLIDLTYLDLHDNKITAIRDGTFNTLNKINYLDLSTNRLSKLPESTLGLANLTTVNLDSNCRYGPAMSVNLLDFITNIADNGDWLNSTSLSCPAAAFCQYIVDVPQSECEALVNTYYTANGNGRLYKTNRLKSNKVHDWYGITTYLGHIIEVDLHNNLLSGSTNFSNLSRLDYLDLAKNTITAITLSGLTNLTSLLLSDNHIQSIDLTDLTSLETLDLRTNWLSSLPESTTHLTHLTTANLEDNCRYLPYMSKNLRDFLKYVIGNSNRETALSENCPVPSFDCSKPSVSFTKADYVDWTLPGNQDCITDNVCITRKNNQGIYNYATENGYISSSPDDTERAYGNCISKDSLTFDTRTNTHGNNPPDTIGQDMCLHLISDDKYYDLIFTAWTPSNAGGGFSYTRTEYIPPPQIDFTKADYADRTLPENQDCITNNVCLTRQDTKELFNSISESSDNDSTSPLDTEWIVGNCTNRTKATFDTWHNTISSIGGNPGSLVGEDICLHLITDNTYYNIHLNSWTAEGNGGGFSYTRTDYPGTQIEIPQNECEALVALYSKTNGNYWTDHSNRLRSKTIADWYGITLDGGRISDLVTNSNNLVGVIPSELSKLSRVNSIDFDDNKITSIETGAFSGLGNLSYLDIGSNRISSLKKNAFYTLPNLSYLGLYNNQLKSIDTSTFYGLDNINQLDISSNQITSIQTQAMKPLTSLHELDANNNQIASLSKIDLNGLDNLGVLGLGSNQITTIPGDFFNGLGSLSTLYLDWNPLISFNGANIPSGVTNLNISNACNTNGTQTIEFNQTATSIDSNRCVLIISDIASDFSGALVNKGYSKDNNGYYVGNYPISFNDENTDIILVPTIMESSNSNGYSQDYYQNKVQAQFDAGTEITQNGNPFTGVLQSPTLFDTGDVFGMKEVDALMRFGDLSRRIDFSQDVTIRMPVLGKNIDDVVNIYSSDAEDISSNGATRTLETTATVFDGGNGIPYVEFTASHASRWSVGVASFCATVTDVPSYECEALAALYNNTEGSGWINTGGRGVSTTVGSWDGITVVGGHIQQINLSSYNLVGTIPAGFSNLTGLQNLNLYGNQIVSIETGAFSGFSSLEMIDVSSNLISSLPAGIFDSLTNLLTLYIYSNQLTGLPPGIFDSLTNLTNLDIDSNQITSLPVGIFDSLSSLIYLYINYNKLASLPAGIFDTLTNLSELYLDNNQLTLLHDGIFNSLSNLNYLYANNNQLASLPAGIFNSLSSLNYLDLSTNKLTLLPTGIFDTLSNLYGLYLSNNPITSFSAGIFDGLTNVTTLFIYSACNTAGTETIGFPLGSTTTDNSYCAALPDTNPTDFTGELEAKGYTRDGTYSSYVGNSPISFDNPSTSNQFLEAVAMASLDTYPGIVRYQNGTLITQNGNPFTGVLHSPVLFATGNVPGMTNTTTLMRFGDLKNKIDFDTLITVVMPAPGKTMGDVVSVYSTDAESIFDGGRPAWQLETTGIVSDVLGIGEPYISFNTRHASRWAIGDSFCSTVTDVPSYECDALAALYGSTNGQSWNDNTNRGIDTTVGNWYGITVGGGQVQQITLGSNNLSGTIPAGFSNLGGLELLDLSTNYLPVIQTGAFDGFTSLLQLSLEDDKIGYLISDEFAGAPNLVYLAIGSNGISNIDYPIFSGLPNLNFLLIDKNKISHIAGGTFDGAPNLIGISIGSNTIKSIDSGTFAGLYNLTGVNLSSNKIASINSGTFDGRPPLEYLDLSSNYISLLPSNTFDALPNLVTLDLRGNQIPSLYNGIFSSLSNLTTLDVSANQIASLHNEDFSGLPALDILRIGSNQISSIQSGTFDGLSSLTALDVASNNMIDIASGTFNGPTNLTTLYLGNNQFLNLNSSIFGGLGSLSSLDISYSCNTNGAGTIYYAGGSASIDNDYCVAIPDVIPANFTGELVNKGYIYNGSEYEGSYPLSFNKSPPADNVFHANVVMTSTNPNSYGQSYYQSLVYILYKIGTNIKLNGNPFTGVLYGPTLFATGDIPGLTHVVAVMRFGDLKQKITFNQDVKIQVPAIGKTVGDLVNIYSSDNENIYSDSGVSGTFETGITVTSLGGQPYIQFYTNHASRWVFDAPGACSIVTDIPPIECAALVALYNNTDGPHRGDSTNRLSGTLAENWYGIQVYPGGGTGVVSRIDLHNNRLSGAIPPEIGDLSSLGALDISENNITDLPKEIGNLGNLVWLQINNNKLTSLPREIGYLGNLQGLFAGGNQISSISGTSMAGLTSLLYLDFGGTLSNIAFGRNINKGGNNLTSVPGAYLPSLERLDLSDNNISSLSPFGNTTNLQYVLLNDNNLTSLPSWIGNGSSIIALTLGGNQLTGLPADISGLVHLQLLDLGSDLVNKYLLDTYGVTAHLSTGGNQITTLPAELWGLTGLSSLGLSQNKITTIPTNITNLSNLSSLYINNNRLFGLPEEFTGMTSLTDTGGMRAELNCWDTGSMSSLLLNFVNLKVGDTAWQSPLNPTCPIPPVVIFTGANPADNIWIRTNSFTGQLDITEAYPNQFERRRSGVNYSLYDSGLVFMANFDNVSSLGESNGVATDLSSYGANIVGYGGVNWTGNGRRNGAYAFNGTNGYFEIADNSGINIAGSNITMSVWIKINKCPTAANLIFEKEAQYTLNLYNGCTISYADSSNRSYVNFGYKDIGITTGAWNYIVVTKDSSNFVSLYRNGIYQTGKTFGGAISQTSNNLLIGNYLFSTAYFSGLIDEPRIYNRTLSSGEIARQYNANLNKYDTNKWNFITFQTGLTDGIFRYTGFVSNINLISTTTGRNIGRDTANPLTTFLLSPTSGQVLSTGNITLLRSGAVDTGSGISGYIYQVSTGTSFTTFVISGTKTTTGVGLLGFTDGTYYRRAYAFDLAGNTGARSTGWNFIINITTIPVITFTGSTPADNAWITTNSFTAQLNIATTNLSQFIRSRSGTNYSIYDSGVGLLMNFDKITARGESDSNIKDWTINGNTGAISGAVTWTGNGKFGGAYILSGGYITVPSSGSIDPTTGRTLSAWIKRNVVGQQQGIMEKFDRTAGRGSYALRIENDKLIAYVLNGTSYDVCGTTTTLLAQYVRYYVTATFDSTTHILKCYVNGVGE
ncbi:MAG: leucine-rich repeat protein, partial [candidate division SR1 bacterium]|nr:leucine-rich repeat protein [candidate division SR1 bacterium]